MTRISFSEFSFRINVGDVFKNMENEEYARIVSVNNANKSRFVRADIFHVNNEGNIVIDATKQPFTIGWNYHTELIFDEDGLPFHPDMDEVMLQDEIQDCRYMFRKKTRAALRIQRAFKTAISNPNYAMCRTRLLNEFNSLIIPD